MDKAKMAKEEIKLPGGRKLIYYTFEKKDKAEDQKKCQS